MDAEFKAQDRRFRGRMAGLHHGAESGEGECWILWSGGEALGLTVQCFGFKIQRCLRFGVLGFGFRA